MNFAGAAHFDSLIDEETFARLEQMVMNEVGAERAGGRAGGGIFHDTPGQHAAGAHAAATFDGEAIGHGAVWSDELRERTHVHLNFCQNRAARDRHHQIGNARGNEFDGQRRHQVAGLEAESGGERGAAEGSARKARGFLGHGDAHGAAVVESEFDRKNSGAGLLQDVHRAFGRRNHAEFGEQKPGADDRMSGERKLLRRGENAQAGERAIIGGTLDENRLRQIHFAGDGLHSLGGEAVAVGDDRERIAGKLLGGENVESVKTALHEVTPLDEIISGLDAFELMERAFVLDVSGV